MKNNLFAIVRRLLMAQGKQLTKEGFQVASDPVGAGLFRAEIHRGGKQLGIALGGKEAVGF